MKDELGELYTESVVGSAPQKLDKKVDRGEKGLANVKMEKDFGFEKKGQQKGTGPDKSGAKKPKELKEETEMNEPIAAGSQFEELFKRTIKEDFEDGGDSAEFGADEFGGADDSEFSDDEGGADEEGGGETDLRSTVEGIISQLQSILDNIEGGDEGGDEETSDVEDLATDSAESEESDDEGEDDEEEEVEEAASAGMSKERDGKIHPAPKDIKHLQGKNNKSSGYYGKKTMKGSTGDPGGDKARDGKLRPAPGFNHLQGKGNMKVAQSGVPGKQGAGLFD